LSPGKVFRKNASLIKSYFEQVPSIDNAPTTIHASVDVYTGKNIFVGEMMKYLEENVQEDIVGAYVHGSFGTYEEINYSDFDGLVILKDEVIKNGNRLANVVRHLSETRKFMLQIDPLQHHGWFVLTESDLNNYPQTLFPSELFQYAKSLFNDQGRELNLRIDYDKQDYSASFIRLCKSIERKLTAKKYPQNMYELKNLLSEFMLLPALYIQSRDKKGVFKKFSFEEARKDFSQQQWRIMDEVSLVRQQWKMQERKRKLLTHTRLLSFNMAKILSPAIPKELNQRMDDKFYQSMLDFTKAIRAKTK